MGTCLTPSYANLFMGRLEQLLLGSYPSPPSFAWWQYIDDVFAVWTHGIPLLKLFLDHINSCHPSITFTTEWFPMSVSFLDTKVTLKVGQVQTDLFCNPTDKHQYLHWNIYYSCHPQHNKTSIPYRQALFLRRICSQESVFKQQTSELQLNLQKQGFPPPEPALTAFDINQEFPTTTSPCWWLHAIPPYPT